MRKSALRITIFLIILCLVLGYLDRVFCFKYADGITPLTSFYELDKDTVDVLIIGSSHAFVNFNNGTLWNEYGIASYTLGGSIQPMWNTYYYLKEALKTQSPELIVLESYALTLTAEYSDDSRIIKNTYGLKWSPDKVKAIKVSSPPDRFNDFLITYGQYHNRYHDLNRSDFLRNDDILIDTSGQCYPRDWKGQYLFYDSNPQVKPDVSNVDDRADIAEKEMIYYKKILELAKEHEIPIIVTVVPYVLSAEEQRRFNTAYDIAKEYDADFLNCNLFLPETGLDFDKDYRDMYHMNCLGSQKFTTFFGQFIKEKYDISDRRGDERYTSWQTNAEYTAQYGNDMNLLNITNIEKLGSSLLNRDYYIFLSVDGSCNTEDPVIRGLFDALNLKASFNGICFITSDGIIWYSGSYEDKYYIRKDTHDIYLKRQYSDEYGAFVNHIIVDNSVKKVVDNGLNVVVYDNKLKTVIDSIGINAEDHSVTHICELNTF